MHYFIQLKKMKINIKVLGTSFNVRNYPQDKESETSLIKGKIEVSLKSRPEDIIILKPTEKLIIAKEQDELSTLERQQSRRDAIRTDIDTNGSRLVRNYFLTYKFVCRV